MRRVLLVDGDEVSQGDIELLDRWSESASSWIWVDLHDEDADSERAMLEARFGFESMDIIEAERPRHPPGIRFQSDYTYLLTRPLDPGSTDLDFQTLQLAVFIGDGYIVTRRSKVSNYIEQLWTQMCDSGQDSSPMTVLVSILRRITARYASILLDLEARLDVIEDEIFLSTSENLLKELSSYNTSLRKMRRLISYQDEVFSQLAQSVVLDEEDEHDIKLQLDDIAALMLRNHTLADMYQNVITDLIDAYISLNGHHLNQIMKVLTIVTVIFVPITFMAGIYGMNFEIIPELKYEYGYYTLLGTMLLIVLALLYVFRRKHWL